MKNAMHFVRNFAKALIPNPLVPVVREAAIRRGWMEEPPFQYPFWQIMAHNRSPRPHYRWGTMCAAFLARTLGYERISVIEFGVAGGNGLVELEKIAGEVERASGVKIDVYGFDTGTGLPKPQDYRDLPQLWGEGDFSMDVERLKSRLTNARLMLGPVGQTVPKFVAQSPAPVGFISFDLDMYTSTMDAFALLDGHANILLPRVVCYFDDINGFSHGDFNGERLAISDFNKAREMRKISKIYGLRYVLNLDQWWTEMMYMFHAFDHKRYNDHDGSNPLKQIPLNHLR